ncbi:MAG: pilin [Patescibacteria group bacterium]
MRFKYFIILIGALIVAGSFSPVQAATVCRSGGGGYCVQLAAVIPGLEFIQYDDKAGVGGFMSSLYTFGLALTGISALLVIVYSSVLYMTSGGESRTADAKKKIQGALLGLAIAFLSYLILRTINPDLVKTLDLTRNFTPITLQPPSGETGTFKPQAGSGAGKHDVGLGGDCQSQADCSLAPVALECLTPTPPLEAYGKCLTPRTTVKPPAAGLYACNPAKGNADCSGIAGTICTKPEGYAQAMCLRPGDIIPPKNTVTIPPSPSGTLKLKGAVCDPFIPNACASGKCSLSLGSNKATCQ